MNGQVDNAFAFVRPPGHHAGKERGAGFCLFNNVAVGARYALGKYGLKRILIQQRCVNSRNGVLSVRPEEKQPMDGLDHLWQRGINSQDDEELERDLIAAERQLSSIRSELHGMIADATGELVARYSEDPMLALTALPTRVQRPSPL